MPPGLLTSSGGSTGRAREPKMRSGFRVEICFIKKKKLLRVELIYGAVVVSSVQQSDCFTYTYIHSFSFFSMLSQNIE